MIQLGPFFYTEWMDESYHIREPTQLGVWPKLHSTVGTVWHTKYNAPKLSVLTQNKIIATHNS